MKVISGQLSYVLLYLLYTLCFFTGWLENPCMDWIICSTLKGTITRKPKSFFCAGIQSHQVIWICYFMRDGLVLVPHLQKAIIICEQRSHRIAKVFHVYVTILKIMQTANLKNLNF